MTRTVADIAEHPQTGEKLTKGGRIRSVIRTTDTHVEYYRSSIEVPWLRPFSPEEDQIILSGKGRTSTSIAVELGRAPSVVRLRARRLGIPSWKHFSGGIKDYRGYKVARIDSADGASRRVPEHREVVERHLGRSLTDAERVHHINGRKRDNNIDNLHLFPSDSAHSRSHHSITALLPSLLERGVIHFDRSEGIYRLCEIRK